MFRRIQFHGPLDESGEAAAAILLIPSFQERFFLWCQVEGKLLITNFFGFINHPPQNQAPPPDGTSVKIHPQN